MSNFGDFMIGEATELKQEIYTLRGQLREAEAKNRAMIATLEVIKKIASGEDQYFRGRQIEDDTAALGIIWVESNATLSLVAIKPDTKAVPDEIR